MTESIIVAGSALTAPRLLKGHRLPGCNIHHHTTVFVQRFAPGSASGLRVSDLGADFPRRFIERFGGLESLTPGGCLSEAARTSLAQSPAPPVAHALLVAIVAVERFMSGAMRRLDSPTFSRVVNREGFAELVWESRAAWISRAAARAAFTGLVELLPDSLRAGEVPVPDFATTIARLRRKCRRRQWSPTVAVLAHSLKRRRLPHAILADSYLRVGEGVTQHIISETALDLSPGSETGGAHRSGSGTRYRVLVAGGRLVSALRCDPPAVVGDGSSTIGQLIERLNDPLRRSAVLPPVTLDPPLQADLAVHGLETDHVPAAGEHIVLPGVTTIERGAVPVDITLQVPASVADAVLKTTAKERQDVVTVDCVAGDLPDGDDPVCQALVTARPSLFLHALLGGSRTTVGDAILDLIVPEGVPGGIPIALVVGQRGARAVARSLDRLLRTVWDGVGLAIRGRMTIEGRAADPTSLGRRQGPEALLGEPCASVVIGAMSPERIVARGLRLEHCRVIAFLDPAPGEDLGRYKAGIEACIAASEGVVVMGAGNPYVDLVLRSVNPALVFLVAERERRRAPQRYRDAGASVILLRRGPEAAAIELWRDKALRAVLPLTALTRPGSKLGAKRRTRALYSAGLAFGLGLGTLPVAPLPRLMLQVHGDRPEALLELTQA